jgi:hypothetical protein
MRERLAAHPGDRPVLGHLLCLRQRQRDPTETIGHDKIRKDKCPPGMPKCM